MFVVFKKKKTIADYFKDLTGHLNHIIHIFAIKIL